MVKLAWLLALTACSVQGPFRASGDDGEEPTDAVGDDSVDGDTDDVPAPDAPPPDVPPTGPQLVTETQGIPTALVWSDDYLYWTEARPNRIARLPRGGGAIERFTAPDEPVSIAAHGSTVAWTSTSGVYRFTDATFAATSPLFSSVSFQYEGTNAVVTATNTYVVDYGTGTTPDGRVLRIPHTGTTPATALQEVYGPLALAVGASSLFWSTSLTGVLRAPFTNLGSQTTLGDAIGAVTKTVVAGDRVCWLRYTGDERSRDIVCRTGSGVRVIAANQPYALELAISADAVFWPVYDGTGRIERFTFATGVTDPVVELGADRRSPALVVTDGRLVWMLDDRTGTDGIYQLALDE